MGLPLKFQSCFNSNGQDIILFTNGADPSAHYYQRTSLTPDEVYNLLEDKKSELLFFELNVTDDDFKWLTTYDPALSRDEKLGHLCMKDLQRLRTERQPASAQDEFVNGAAHDKKLRVIWQGAIGAEMIAREQRFFSLDDFADIANEELQKGWDAWLAQRQPAPDAKKGRPAPL